MTSRRLSITLAATLPLLLLGAWMLPGTGTKPSRLDADEQPLTESAPQSEAPSLEMLADLDEWSARRSRGEAVHVRIPLRATSGNEDSLESPQDLGTLSEVDRRYLESLLRNALERLESRITQHDAVTQDELEEQARHLVTAEEHRAMLTELERGRYVLLEDYARFDFRRLVEDFPASVPVKSVRHGDRFVACAFPLRYSDHADLLAALDYRAQIHGRGVDAALDRFNRLPFDERARLASLDFGTAEPPELTAEDRDWLARCFGPGTQVDGTYLIRRIR